MSGVADDKWIGHIEEFLDEFRAAMLAKFWARHEKQLARGTKSVVDPMFDWRRDLDLKELEDHLREELQEWLEDGADREAESVDGANMFFLDWMAWRVARERSEHSCERSTSDS